MKYKAKKIEALKIPKANGKDTKSSSSTRSSNRKKTFHDDDGGDDSNEIDNSAEVINAALMVSDGNNDENGLPEDDDNAPEIIHSNDDSILALRQSHQSISFLSQSSNKKIKKREPSREVKTSINKIEMLDESVLEALTSSLDKVQHEQKKSNSHKNLSTYVSQRKPSESHSLNSIKKIGNFEVSVMDDDVRAVNPLTSFPLSTSAAEFSKNLYTGHMRTRYAVYSAQKNKSGIPSKRFALANQLK